MDKATKPVITIGPKEFLDFPGLGLIKVPAKIDTGADSSAIWASNIEEKDGTLSFTLFDRVSPFYNGEVISTKTYSVTSIKNSFGQTEFRYRVTLRVTIEQRTINVRFTLANRENNRYPVLIGRRTLHGKFIVDVAATNPELEARRMLILSSKKTSNVTDFVKAVEEAYGSHLKITHTTYNDVKFSFTTSGTHITLLSTGEDIAVFDLVHFKTTVERDITAAMARYLQKRGVPIVDEAVANFPADSKLYQYVVLANENVPIPSSVFLMPDNLDAAFDTFNTELGLPFVLKDIHGSRGEANYVIADESDYKRVIKSVKKNNVYVVGQKFIPNDGDFRILVLGRRIALVIHRSRQDDTTHLNNTSKGGNARLIDLVDLPTHVQTNSLIATKAMGRGVAGVDMVQDLVTKNWYCFEVNAGPQIATGAFLVEKQKAFAQFVKTELGK